MKKEANEKNCSQFYANFIILIEKRYCCNQPIIGSFFGADLTVNSMFFICLICVLFSI